MSTPIKNLLASTIFTAIIISSMLLALTSCGGGGGGGDDEGDQAKAAQLSLQVDPTTLDSGDRMTVTVQMHEIDRDGLLLKVQYPPEINYVDGSSFLKVDGDEIDISPAAEVTTGKSGEERSYLVYDLGRNAFNGERSATVRLRLEASGEVLKGDYIAVDADFNDRGVDFDQKFNPLAPEFDAADRKNIRVEDSSGSITPTPTPTPTSTNTPAPTATKKS